MVRVWAWTQPLVIFPSAVGKRARSACKNHNIVGTYEFTIGNSLDGRILHEDRRQAEGHVARPGWFEFGTDFLRVRNEVRDKAIDAMVVCERFLQSLERPYRAAINARL